MIRKLSLERAFLRAPWPWGRDATVDTVYPGVQTQLLGSCDCGDMILRLRYMRDPVFRPGEYTAWFPPFCSTVECLVRVRSDEAGHLARTGQWSDPALAGQHREAVTAVH